MAESGMPDKLLPAVRLAVFWISLPFIFLLVAVERYFDAHGNGYQIAGCVAGAFLSILIAVYWDKLAACKFIPHRLKSSPQLSQMSISDGMYIGEININLNKVKEHHIEVAIRAFNGTGSVVSLEGIQGSIRYREMGGVKELSEMPPAAVRSDTSKNVLPGKEWLIILAQHVPGKMGDEIATLAAAESKRRLEFDLTKLDIQVTKAGQVDVPTRLPLWGGVSHSWDHPRLGRIIHASVNQTLGASDKFGGGS